MPRSRYQQALEIVTWLENQAIRNGTYLSSLEGYEERKADRGETRKNPNTIDDETMCSAEIVEACDAGREDVAIDMLRRAADVEEEAIEHMCKNRELSLTLAKVGRRRERGEGLTGW